MRFPIRAPFRLCSTFRLPSQGRESGEVGLGFVSVAWKTKPLALPWTWFAAIGRWVHGVVGGVEKSSLSLSVEPLRSAIAR